MDWDRILWITSQNCTENDLLQKLLGLRSSASDMSALSGSTNSSVILKRIDHSGAPVASLTWCNVLSRICPESLDYGDYLPERDQIPL